jgi:hypothetical protein
MGFRGTSRAPSSRSRTIIGFVLPVRRSSPFGSSTSTLPTDRSLWTALRAFAPLQRTTSRARAAIRRCRFLVALPLLNFVRPTAQSQQVVLRMAATPVATARHVRGLVTPLAARHTPTSTSSALERPWAFSFTGFPSRAVGTPLGVRALLPLQSSSGLCSRGESVLHQHLQKQAPGCISRRSRLGFRFPLQSVLPLDPARALVAEPPLTPLDGVTSLAVWVSGSLESSELDGSSLNCQLSWGLSPCG